MLVIVVPLAQGPLPLYLLKHKDNTRPFVFAAAQPPWGTAPLRCKPVHVLWSTPGGWRWAHYDTTQCTQTFKLLQSRLITAVCLCFCILSCIEAAICWCCHCYIIHTNPLAYPDTRAHTYKHKACPKGSVGVNMFGAIMPDHLIMTRPSGSWACLSFFPHRYTCW